MAVNILSRAFARQGNVAILALNPPAAPKTRNLARVAASVFARMAARLLVRLFGGGSDPEVGVDSMIERIERWNPG